MKIKTIAVITVDPGEIEQVVGLITDDPVGHDEYHITLLDMYQLAAGKAYFKRNNSFYISTMSGKTRSEEIDFRDADAVRYALHR